MSNQPERISTLATYDNMLIPAVDVSNRTSGLKRVTWEQKAALGHRGMTAAVARKHRVFSVNENERLGALRKVQAIERFDPTDDALKPFSLAFGSKEDLW